MANKRHTNKQKLEREEQQRRADLIESDLFEALQVMEMPTRTGITLEHEFVELFPCPIFNGTKVVGVEYKTTKAVLLPEELLEALCSLEDEIEEKAHKRTSNVDTETLEAYTEVVKAHENDVREDAPKKIGRPSKYTESDVIMMVELLESGLTYGKVATLFKSSANTISYHVNKYKKKHQEATTNE